MLSGILSGLLGEYLSNDGAQELKIAAGAFF
jgi:hypothetical protein